MEIVWLEIGDRPELWRRLGFVVDGDGRCVIGPVEHRLVGPGTDPGGARRGPSGTTPVAAVQPGRRIAALTRAAGSTLPMAFMSPHIRTN